MELDEYITVRNLSDIKCVYNGKSLDFCSCHITSHHLMVVAEKATVTPRELTFLHKQIDSIEQSRVVIIDGQQTTAPGPTLVLKMKDFAILAILFHPDISPTVLSGVTSTLSNLSNIDTLCFFYPFYYSPETPTLSADGWESFSLETEFRSIFNSSFFRLSNVNKDFSVCETYPKTVVVPKSVDDDTLIRSAAFRRHYRFPTAAYCHKNGAVLLRSAEPLIGQNGIFRCREDENLLNSFLKGDSRGVIIDTRHHSLIRPRQNRGGGTEPLASYPRWNHQNQPIDRPEAMKKSFERLIELLVQRKDLPIDGFLDKLSNTAWLHVVRDVLNCACVAAQLIDRDAKSVLFHGAEGLDTTLAVSSLSQVVLSSDCRTIRGFIALIDREWVNAGHPFRSRCFKGPFAVVQNRESAPTFLIFLDCVWQITQQFPCSFEFTDKLLILLFRHAYFSEYGTFMCNNEREKKLENVYNRTISLWSHLLKPEVVETLLNPLFEPNRGEAIWPSVQPVALDLWRSLYLANADPFIVASDEERWRRFTEIVAEHKELLAVATRLKRQLALLKVEAQQQQQISSKSTDSGISSHTEAS